MDILSIGLSGMTSSRIRALASANNLANLNTPGYRAQRADSGSLRSGGAAVDSVSVSQAPAAFRQTGNPLDLAINGEGFFQVADGAGGASFTRDGSFSTGADGTLINSQGLPLEPPIQVPQGASNINVGPEGIVTADVNGQNQELGRIQLANFSNPDGLTRTGGNLAQMSGASGAPQAGAPGQGGRGFIVSGFIETSNVEIAREAINLQTETTLTRANAAVIRTGDEMTREAIDLIG